MANLDKDYYLDKPGVQTLISELETNTLADEYSSSATYAVGDYCIHNNKIYRCTTAISTAESWADAHWTLVIVGDELKTKKSGTVTSVTIKGTSPIVSSSSSAITTSGTRTISHADSGVTAGTYKSVTVNATGHVTAGSNPTTLSGYGIIDAKIESGTITLGSNTITPLTSHQSITDNNPTLDWETQSKVATIGSTDIHVTMPSNPNTDKSVTAVASDPTSTTGYYPIMVTGATNQQPKYSSKSAFKFNITNGTASDNGWSSICIGNNIASGTANNMKGYLTLYSSGTYRTNLTTNTITENTDVYLPTTSGTLALTSQIPTITDTYSGTSSDGMSGKAVKSAIDALDGGTIGTPSASKTLTALSQTNGNISATFADIAIANTQVSGLGTASVKDVPASGNASSTQVVMGNDTRLTDSRTPKSHSHGNIANGGTISSTAVTPASGDYILISDTNASGKIERGIALGTSTTTYLTNKGTWATPVGTTYTGTGLISISASNVISTTAEVNQNAFSTVKVGSTSVSADTKTDTLTLEGSNVTLTPDATNDKVTIGITSSNVTGALGYTPYNSTNPAGYTTNTGTVTSITLKATSPISIDSSSAIIDSGTRTLSHATSGVTAGTYRSVTVNATGHVTGGTSPTTISGYGITDAKIASGVITLGSNTITPLTASSTLDATKLSGTIPSGCYTDTKNTAGSTNTSSKIFLIGATSQAANPQTYSDDQCYVTSGALACKSLSASTTISATSGVSANTGNSKTAGGLALYSTAPASYGIAMRGTGSDTGNLGTHGYVQGDWATYFCMNAGTAGTRGWIYRNYSSTLASIDVAGNAVFNGSVTVGGNADNTSGCRLTYNSTTKSCDFVFA